MSHHSRETLQSDAELRRLIESEAGPTLKYPRGHLTPSDEGEIQIKIAADPKSNTVVIDFGKPTAWIGFDYEQAHAIANSLIQKANELRGITT